MPARKPKALIRRHETAAEKADREAREESVRPGGVLPHKAPARLRGHAVASAAWRRMMREFTSIEGEIVTRLDMDVLVDYCILTEQVVELDRMRRAAYEAWLAISEGHDKAMKQGKTDDALEMAIRTVGALDTVVKVDSRADRKRALLLQMRQAMYLTPRARAGAAPQKKNVEENEKDELEKLLDDVTNYVNGE